MEPSESSSLLELELTSESETWITSVLAGAGEEVADLPLAVEELLDEVPLPLEEEDEDDEVPPDLLSALLWEAPLVGVAVD